jgi:hypothetical protein
MENAAIASSAYVCVEEVYHLASGRFLVARVVSRLSTILPDIFGTMGDTGDTAAGCWLRAWEVTRPGRPPFYT